MNWQFYSLCVLKYIHISNSLDIQNWIFQEFIIQKHAVLHFWNRIFLIFDNIMQHILLLTFTLNSKRLWKKKMILHQEGTSTIISTTLFPSLLLQQVDVVACDLILARDRGSWYSRKFMLLFGSLFCCHSEFHL